MCYAVVAVKPGPFICIISTHYAIKIRSKSSAQNDINKCACSFTQIPKHPNTHKHIRTAHPGEKGKHYAAKSNVLCALTYLFDFNRPKKFTRINAKTLIYDEIGC